MCAACSIPASISLRFDPLATIHISQVLAGFSMLRSDGLCSLRITREPTAQYFGHNQVVIARPQGRPAIIFDLHDDGTPQVSPEQYQASMEALGASHYFRRSASNPGEALGFNYHVSCRGNPYQAISVGDITAAAGDGLARHILLRKALSRLPFGPLSDRHVWPERFAQGADHPQDETILFLTRTWFPIEEHPGKSEGQLVREIPRLEEILRMDETRAELIAMLRKEYGKRAVTGLTPTPYARMRWPELIASPALTKKTAYLQTMRRAAVCLTTTGLHRSTGWKFGEYVAAAKAIASEPLQYTVPGPFAAGENYLPFESPAQALEQAERLRTDQALRQAMQRRNADYYEAFLRPDRLVFRALNCSL